MNMQQMVDANIRMMIGNLQVELVVAQARIAELEAQIAQTVPAPPDHPFPEGNGAFHPEVPEAPTEAP